MNFSKLNEQILFLSNSFCQSIILNKSADYRYVKRIRALINSERAVTDPALILKFINSINQGIKIAFKNADMPACNSLFMTADYEDDYKHSIQTLENLYSKHDKKYDPYNTEYHRDPEENRFDSLGLLLDPFRRFLDSNISLYRENKGSFDLGGEDCIVPDAAISELFMVNKELLLKTQYLYMQKQLERQIFNLKHNPGDFDNQRFKKISASNVDEIVANLKGKDIYCCNDEHKLKKVYSLKELHELLYKECLADVKTPVILKDNKNSDMPSVVGDEVRFKLLHLIKPFELEIKNDLSYVRK